MSELSEESWYYLVQLTITEHPEWMNTTILSVQRGFNEALSIQKDKRATAETALAMLYLDGKKISAANLRTVKKAIVESFCFGGSPMAEKLKKELEDER